MWAAAPYWAIHRPSTGEDCSGSSNRTRGGSRFRSLVTENKPGLVDATRIVSTKHQHIVSFTCAARTVFIFSLRIYSKWIPAPRSSKTPWKKRKLWNYPSTSDGPHTSFLPKRVGNSYNSSTEKKHWIWHWKMNLSKTVSLKKIECSISQMIADTASRKTFFETARRNKMIGKVIWLGGESEVYPVSNEISSRRWETQVNFSWDWGKVCGFKLQMNKLDDFPWSSRSFSFKALSSTDETLTYEKICQEVNSVKKILHR